MYTLLIIGWGKPFTTLTECIIIHNSIYLCIVLPILVTALSVAISYKKYGLYDNGHRYA